MTQEINVISFEKSKKIEKYDRVRLRDSVITACLNVKTPEGQANKTADSVCDEFEKWLEGKQEITDKDIINKITRIIKKYHTEASYIYEQKHIII